MTRPGMRSALLALAIGAGAGYACALLHTPIPWMLGPLFSLAFLRVAGVDVGVPAPVRYGGQWIIGTSLGLYFTPLVVREVAGLWYLLARGRGVFRGGRLRVGAGAGADRATGPDDRALRERARRRRGNGGAGRALRRARRPRRGRAEPAHSDRRRRHSRGLHAAGRARRRSLRAGRQERSTPWDSCC